MRRISAPGITGDFATGMRISRRPATVGDFATGMRSPSTPLIADELPSEESVRLAA